MEISQMVVAITKATAISKDVTILHLQIVMTLTTDMVVNAAAKDIAGGGVDS